MAWSADKVKQYRGTSSTTPDKTSGSGWTADKIRAMRQSTEAPKPVTRATVKAPEDDDPTVMPSIQDRSAAAKQRAKITPSVEPQRPKLRGTGAMNKVDDWDKAEIDAAKKQGTQLGVGKTLGTGAMMGVNEADAGITKIARDVYNVSAAPLRPWNVTIGGKTLNVNPINQANTALQKYVAAPLRDVIRKQDWLPAWMKPAPESEIDPNRDIIAETLDKMQVGFEGNAQAYQQQLDTGTPLEGTVGRAAAEVTKMAPQIATAFLTRGASLLPGEVAGGTAIAAQAAMRPGISGLSGETLFQAGQDLAQMAPFGVQALGGYLRDAEQKGATPIQQWTAAVPQASLEVVTEMIPFGFMKKAFGITDDAFRAASKAGSKKAATYFGQLAKNQVYEAATEIVQEVGINPFTSAIEKAVYSPNMPWAGQGGVVDLQEAAETAKVTGVMSLLLAGLGLPVSSPGHIRALRMLQEPATVTEHDVTLLEDEVKTGTEQQADPVQATAAQMAKQLFPDAQQQVEQTVTQDVQAKQAAKEDTRSAIESIAYSEQPVEEPAATNPVEAIAPGMANAGKGIVDGMYDMLWKGVSTGKWAIEPEKAGILDQLVKKMGDAGQIQSRDDVVSLAKDFTARGGNKDAAVAIMNEAMAASSPQAASEQAETAMDTPATPQGKTEAIKPQVEAADLGRTGKSVWKKWSQNEVFGVSEKGADHPFTTMFRKLYEAGRKSVGMEGDPTKVRSRLQQEAERSFTADERDMSRPWFLDTAYNAGRDDAMTAKPAQKKEPAPIAPETATTTPVAEKVSTEPESINQSIDTPHRTAAKVAFNLGKRNSVTTMGYTVDVSKYGDTYIATIVKDDTDGAFKPTVYEYRDYDRDDAIVDVVGKLEEILSEKSKTEPSAPANEQAAQEPAKVEEKKTAPEPVSPAEERLAELDKKMDRLIEAVSGKMELKGSESNAKEQPVSGEQLAVEGGGSASSEGSGKVRAASRKQEPGQPGADDGTAGNDGVRADGTGDAAETRSGSEQRPMGAPSAGGSRGSRKPRAAQSGLHTRNYRITPDDVLFEGGKKTRFKNNVAAIRLMKQIEAEGRAATADEQKTLLKYVGWGGIAEAFDKTWDRARNVYVGSRPDWLSEFNELRDLLTREEYEAAARSTQNAHYTHPDIINAMYAMAKKLGFKGGTVLEPSSGTGHFIGLLPEEFLSSRFLAVEKDSITGRIAKLLYPDADVRVSGFEEVAIPNNYFDMAISNVPFGDIRIYDPSYKAGYITERIHNYFFVKALDKVKPGGAVMFITSAGTLNARDEAAHSIRRHIAANADLVAAFRLPGDAFKENAGTEVTTDIIILRKRIPGEIPHGPAFQEVAPIDVSSKTLYTNEYFVTHPENVLGKHVEDKLWGGRLAVANDGDFENHLRNAIKALPSGVFNPIKGTIEELTPEQEAKQLEAVKNNAYFMKDGVLHQKHGNMSVKVESPQLERMTALVGIKDAVKEVLAAQLREVSDAELSALQTKLSKRYDAFVKKYGSISDKANTRVLRADPENYLLNSLEVYNKKTDKVEKAGIFSRRIVKKYRKPDAAGTPAEAIAISLYETGRLDMSRVADLLGMTDEQAGEALSGYAFKNPAGSWETSDEYLSGNVRQKLAEARQAATLDKRYLENVSALEKVQPEDIQAADIDVKLGSSWLPTSTMSQFVASLLEVPQRMITASYNKVAGTWSFTADSQAKHNYQSKTKWGAEGWTAIDLIDTVANMKQPVYIYEDEEGNKVVDQEKTAALKAKADEIKEAFAEWIWKDQERRSQLETIYNDRFNAIRNREYTGMERTYPGMSEIIALRKHQREGVERIVYGGNTMLAHGVGFGKTYIMLTGAMELKRLGIANKPMFVVPNDKLSDFQNDMKVMYPNAKVLAAAEDDFKPENIRSLFAQIATNDWDAVIVRHSSFTKIPTSKATQEAYIQEQIQEVEQAILEAAGEKDKKVTKQLEKTKENLEAKLKGLSEMKKIDLLTFEEMGIDYLFVDEAHEFKNLRTYTKLSNVKGLNTTGGPTTEDFYSKVRYVAQLHGGKRGLVFATGTPISNSLNELFTLFKYLRPDLLLDSGVKHFDAWMSTFGNVENRTEIKHDGRFKPVDRFRSFVNVEELMSMFKEFADIRMDKADVNLEVPDLDGGKPIVNESKPHPKFKAFGKQIIDRMNNLPKRPGKGEDNALSISGDARRATTDMRLIDPAYGDFPDSKINRSVKNVVEIYKSTGDRKATQMVFLGEGRSYVKGVEPKVVKFDAYADIRAKLIKAGIPADEVVFAEKYKTKEQKEQLYKDMNSGKIRVIIGSYALMGTGLNIQERLYAIHEIDVPWRPSDIEQSEGRMIRQGNMHKEWGIPVKIHRYIVAGEGSFDAFMWQLQESKLVGQQKFYKGGVRKVEVEEDADVEMVRQMKAMATGNPLVIKKVELESKLTALRGQKKSHQRGVMESEDRIAQVPSEIAAAERFIAAMKKDLERRDIPAGESFTIKVGGKRYTDRAKAAEALAAAVKIATDTLDTSPIAEYAGFNLVAMNPLGAKGAVSIEGNAKYYAYFESTGIGMFTSINNALNGIEDRIERQTLSIANLTKELADRKEDVKKPFAHEAELRGVSEELHQVNAEMERQYKEKDSGIDRQDEDEVPDEFKGETPPELDFASEGGYIRLPGPKPKREGSHYRFADDELEAQHEAARLTPASVMDKVKTWAAEFSTASTRTFRHVDPKLAKNSEFISAMVKYPKLKSMAGGRAVRILNDILQREGSELSVEEYNLFNRYILLRDLKEEVEAKHLLPGKWTPEAVEAYLSEVEGLLTDKTREAVKRRDAYNKKIKDEYISAMGALGWNVRKRFDRKNYFRHQVLEYAQAKITGGGGRINVKRGRGWLKQRHGSKMLINEDYLQAEYEVMASMIHDAEVAKMIKDIGREYDIKPQLKRKAKAMVNAALQDIYDAEVAAGKTVTVNVSFGSGAEEAETIERSETEHAMMQFNKKMAIAFGKLQKSAENGSLWDNDGEWKGIVEDLADPDNMSDQRSRLFRYLAELAGTDGDDAISARTILKAVSDRKKATIDLLGDAYVEWDDIIPEGYVEFAPIIGRHFYAANAVTENLANALMSGNLKELGLSDMKVQKVMVQGSPFNTFVIPAEYQATMEDVYGQIKNGSIDNAVAAFMKGWKMWQLHLNPWRFVKYNIRNATGDFEKLMSAAGLKGVNPVYAKRAAKELFDAMRFNRFTPDLIDFRDKGGMQDNLYVQEIAAINEAKIFREYDRKKSNVLQKVLQVPKTWDEFSSNVTEYRENILRYAAYLYYKEDLAAHGGKPSFYGASLRARIDGLKANDDKAYQLSKDALGAYDEISETGRWLRRYLIPFWSFQETNMKFYKRLVENTIHDDEVTAAFGKHAAQSLGITVKLSAKAIRKLGAIAIRVAFFSLALLLWNRLVMGDEDDDLDESIRDNPHLTLGRLPNGDVVYFSRLGSFSDILEWFNLNTIPNEIQDIAEGREDVRHLLEEMAKGPVNKIVNAMAPYLKVPAELLAGKTFYPDAFKPRSIRDLGAYAADQFGLGQEYDRLTGKPVKESYLSSWMNALVYRSDPEQAAYYTILDLKNRYRKNVLGEAPGEGFSNSPKSKALYYFKVALKYGDQKAADKYLAEYYTNGGTDKGLKQSLSTLDPLYGLDDAQRGGFYEWLRPQERTALEKAFRYYDETLGGGQ